MTMEEALGVGYITDAGHTVYNDYVTTSEALNKKYAAAQEEMEGGSNTATTSAETNDDTPPAEFENTAN